MEKTYELPDGNIIPVSNEGFRCDEHEVVADWDDTEIIWQHTFYRGFLFYATAECEHVRGVKVKFVQWPRL